MKPFLNASAYRFVELNDAERLRESMHSRAAALGLRGTVILAVEGINLALAGAAAAMREFEVWLRDDARFAAMEFKFSASDHIPFARLRVKVTPEVIRMNQAVVQPLRGRAPSVDAPTLARWLSEGRDDAGRAPVMLDTRNAVEVGHGRFAGALDWRLTRFSDFPNALREQAAALQGKTVVSYCTGGIRCEKAALWMIRQGVSNVLQLEGGILKYFELTGGAHFEGSCFVFDRRYALDASLAPVPAL